MTTDTGAGELTVRVVEPVTEPELADTVVVPAERLVASPVELTVATPGTDDAQFADCVMS